MRASFPKLYLPPGAKQSRYAPARSIDYCIYRFSDASLELLVIAKCNRNLLVTVCTGVSLKLINFRESIVL